MIPTAGCTIVSKNYLAYARTLCDSFKRFNPDMPFYVLLVDELDSTEPDLKSEPYELIEARNIGIDHFLNAAFRFSILELNTNVKPSFLKFLIKERSVQRIAYFDPDILVTQPLKPVFDALDQNQIILTPHTNSPISMDGLRPNEQDFLSSGVFNLGFVGVKNAADSIRFLDWWEDRCLKLGFEEIRSGLFVDQKWCNFAPCFFDPVGIIRDLGWNMAYWNLHERTLSKKENTWLVNGQHPLLFYHFSGISINEPDQISRHTNRFDLNSRGDLSEIFDDYRRLLKSSGMESFKKLAYKYGCFSNGEPITPLARRLFAANESGISGNDPFSASGAVYHWCKRSGFLGGKDTTGNYTASNFESADWRVKFISAGLRLFLKVFGVEKYSLLMKYLSYITILRNQAIVHKF